MLQLIKCQIDQQQILNLLPKVAEYLKIVKCQYGLNTCVKMCDYIINVKVKMISKKKILFAIRFYL